MNHKWKEEAVMEYGTKPHTCVNCGIMKKWCGGDYQCWQYSWVDTSPSHGGGFHHSIIKTFKRPDCKSKTLPTKQQ